MVYVEKPRRKKRTIADPVQSIYHVQTPKLVESIYAEGEQRNFPQDTRGDVSERPRDAALAILKARRRCHNIILAIAHSSA